MKRTHKILLFLSLFSVITIWGVSEFIKNDIRVNFLLSLYPDIMISDSIMSKVDTVIIFRSSPLITLKNGKKFKIGRLTINEKYKRNDLEELIHENDSLIKKKDNDTIWLINNGTIYIFKLGQIIK